jgi:hypothetical protein
LSRPGLVTFEVSLDMFLIMLITVNCQSICVKLFGYWDTFMSELGQVCVYFVAAQFYLPFVVHLAFDLFYLVYHE